MSGVDLIESFPHPDNDIRIKIRIEFS